MNQNEISNLIIKHVGGAENVIDMYHCMTRLRFKLNDPQKFNTEELKRIPGVINTVSAGNEYQLIIGAEVDKFYNDLQKHGLGKAAAQGNGASEFRLSNLPKTVLSTIVGIMAPIIPVIIGGGMVKVILSIAVLMGMDKASLNYQILSFISDAPYYFLPFYIASSSAKVFKTNQFMAMVMAGVLLHPNFTALVAAGDPITFFNIPMHAVKYGSSVIPVILTVWFMSYLEKGLEKVIPKMLKTMLRPMLLLLITAPVALIVIGPIGSFLGDGVYLIIKFFNDNLPWAVPTLMGAFSPLLVMVGMHLSITPFAVLSISQFGYETLMGPGMLGSNVAQGGAALAIAIKEKHEKRAVAVSSGITALSGITEPALYGVTLKYKKALLCVIASGAIAGLYAGITGVVRYAVASAGFLSLPVFIGENPSNIINAVITAVIALILSFVSTYIFVKVDSDEETSPAETTAPASPETLTSVVNGTVIPLDKVKDEAFSCGALGYGAAIEPADGTICSPIDGTISAIYPTGHAVGITTKNGREILIHIGIDTVKLDGKGFKPLVETGAQVHCGDKLVEIDLDYIEGQGYDSSVIVLALETSKEEVSVLGTGKITTNSPLLQIL